MKKYRFLFIVAVLAAAGSFACAEDAAGIVTDKQNGIYWQDNAFSQKSSEDWDDAELYCDELVLGGMKHWRLPTFKELLSIVDYARSHPAINPLFHFVDEGTYWTSTDFAPTEARAWTIDFRTGETYYNYKTTNHTVRCVKNISSPSTKEKK
jgi:hypothetical protein